MTTGYYNAGTQSATCTKCRQTFRRRPDEGWKSRCFSCWKAQQTDEAYARGFAAGRAEALFSAPPAPPPAALPAGFDKRLRQLLQLAHPDKHGGSALANDVTSWLLEIKRGARQ